MAQTERSGQLCACERCAVHPKPRRAPRCAAERALFDSCSTAPPVTSRSCRHGGAVDAAPGVHRAQATYRGCCCAHLPRAAHMPSTDTDQVRRLFCRYHRGPRAHARPRAGGCELAVCAARMRHHGGAAPAVQLPVQDMLGFSLTVSRCSPAVLEAALGAPLVRQDENRVYASAALSFSTCMVVRAPLRKTRPSCTSVLTLLARMWRPARRRFHRFSGGRAAARCAAEEDAVKDCSWAMRVQPRANACCCRLSAPSVARVP